MKIALGSDHGGFELKNALIGHLREAGHEVQDFGTRSKDSCDYPMIGFEVARAVSRGACGRGILICKTGVGMAIIANKLPGVRAAACYDVTLARTSREHNDCNVLVLAANYSDAAKAKEIADVWLKTDCLGERHARRVEQIKKFEKDVTRGDKK